MKRRATSLLRPVSLIAVIALLGSCVESVTVNAPTEASLSIEAGTVFSFEVNGGNNQTGAAGTTLGVRPSVVVRKPVYGLPLAFPLRNVAVDFVVPSGGGRVADSSTVTNEYGIASAGEWTLGPTAGTQMLFAYVVIDGVRSDSVIFYATATDASSVPPTDDEELPPTNQKPVASFTVTRDGDICTFDGSGSTDDAGIVAYTWRSSDVTMPVKHAPVIMRDCSSAYQPWTEWLIVEDAGELVDSTSHTVLPAPAPVPPPTEEQPPPPPADVFTVTLTADPRETISGPAILEGTHWTVVKATVRNSAGVVQDVTMDNLTFTTSGDTAFVTTARNSPSEFELHTPTGSGSVTITARWMSGATASKQIFLIGPSAPPPTEGSTVTVNSGTTFQTMTGWEATAEIGQTDVAGYAQWRDAVLDLAAADNINRLRVVVPSGIENTRDVFTEWKAGLISESDWLCRRYTTVNDNADPMVLDMSKFSFAELDTTMMAMVLPLKQRLQARGEALGVTISYVAFWRPCGGGEYVHSDPEEYAEFAVAMMTHLRDRFGIVPDTWEVINEPDNTSGIWTVNRLSAGIVAIDRRLKQAGFQVRLVAPSASGAVGALNYYQALLATPAAALISEIGWHRYDDPATSTVQMLGTFAAARGITTAMTEHIGSDHNDLITDVTLGRASTWEQFTLAYPTSDNGAQYYIPQGSSAITASRTKYLRHYFRHVRHGAVRVDATSTSSSVVPLAFRNANGQVTVVIKYNTAGTITVGGLPAGTYSIGFESETTSDGTLPDIIVGSNGIATLSLQSRGVVVLYRR